MASLKNAAKSTQRTHKERHQPSLRSELGLLEKKKDYKLRAKDFNEKKVTLKRLRKKALNKNPDEFYFHMVNSKTEDGVHKEKASEETLTPEQVSFVLHTANTISIRHIILQKMKVEPCNIFSFTFLDKVDANSRHQIYSAQKDHRTT